MKRRKFILGAGAGILALILGDSLWFEKRFIKVKEFDFGKGNTTWNILQITDLHLKKVGNGLQALARKIHKMDLDAICITGDALETRDYHLLEEFLALLPAQTPKYAILGNWEYWAETDIQKLKGIYNKYNGTLLVNQSILVPHQGKNIAISGTDDYLGGNADYPSIEKQLPQSDFHLLLNHCPVYNDTVKRIKTKPIDLILSGHTHGGQIAFLGYAPQIPPGSGRFVKGWYDKDSDTPIFVSSGIGTSLIPFRFGARAEAVLFRIKL